MIGSMDRRLARFAWLVLGYVVAVILWGAYVRATGSGAGCGAHWPLCNGEVVPRAPDAEMLVEFSHRITSGLALLAVVALLAWVRRGCARGHPARRAAGWSLVLMLTEAAVGAGLVLFRLVADNASMARALFMAVHLVNTFLLLACLALTAHFLSGGRPVRVSSRPGVAGVLAAGFAGLLLAGVSGAIAALGDTLFPATSWPRRSRPTSRPRHTCSSACACCIPPSPSPLAWRSSSALRAFPWVPVISAAAVRPTR